MHEIKKAIKIITLCYVRINVYFGFLLPLVPTKTLISTPAQRLSLTHPALCVQVGSADLKLNLHKFMNT